MKTLNIPLLLLLFLSACGQSVITEKRQAPNKGLSYDTRAIYKRMTDEVCDCLSGTKKNHKASVALDSCLKIVNDRFADTLIAIGVDSVSKVFSSYIRWETCDNIFHLLEEEKKAEEAKLLLFKGVFVSQRKLATGEYEITIYDNKTKKKQLLKRKYPFPEDSIKDLINGYELTIEYEIVKNKKTGKNELWLKEGGVFSVMGNPYLKIVE